MKHINSLSCFFLLFACAWSGNIRSDDSELAFMAELYGGNIDGDTTWSGYGALTVPLMQAFGLHVEALADELDNEFDEESRNIGGHLYWRDAGAGLLGIIASHSEFEGGGLEMDVDGVGVEAELYFQPLAIAAQYAWIDSDDALFDDEEFTAVEAHLAAGDAWYLSGGMRSLADEEIGYAEVSFTPGIEWLPFTIYGGATWDEFESQYLGVDYLVYSSANSNLSVFLEGDQGEDDYDGVFLGVTFSRGPVENAPLITLFSDLKGGF